MLTNQRENVTIDTEHFAPVSRSRGITGKELPQLTDSGSDEPGITAIDKDSEDL